MAAAATARRERLSSMCSRDGQGEEEGKETDKGKTASGGGAGVSPLLVVPPTAPGSPAPSTSSSGTEEVSPAMVEVIREPSSPGPCKLLRPGTATAGGSSATTDSGHSSSSQVSSGSSTGDADGDEAEHGAASPSVRGSDKRVPSAGTAAAWWWRLLPSAKAARFHRAGKLSRLPRSESWESGDGSVDSVARPLALTPPRAALTIDTGAGLALEVEEEDEEEGEEAAFRAHLDRLVTCYHASPFCPTPPLPCELAYVFLWLWSLVCLADSNA